MVAEQWISYGILFYGGSVMSALPLSINGLGIREWVLVTGSGLMMIDSARAFSASFLFTLISGVCALIGTSPAPNKSFVIGLNRPNSAKPARPAR